MLKGKTTISMNRLTIIAAVQMYLDATFKESHVVTNVEIDSANYPTGSTFKVELDDGAEAPKAG